MFTYHQLGAVTIIKGQFYKYFSHQSLNKLENYLSEMIFKSRRDQCVSDTWQPLNTADVNNGVPQNPRTRNDVTLRRAEFNTDESISQTYQLTKYWYAKITYTKHNFGTHQSETDLTGVGGPTMIVLTEL